MGECIYYLTTAVSSVLSNGISQPEKMIPMTGDASGLFLPIMGGLLALSAVLLVVYVIATKKKK